jgi:multidrug efflux pump subunit AcrA (membrane-fusion protein)
MENYRSIFQVIFLFNLLFFSCNKSNETKAIVQDIKELVFASGELEWDNMYNLTAQTDGILTKAEFDVGTKVSKSKILAIVDNKSNLVNTKIAQEQLHIANINLSDNSPQIQALEQNILFIESKYNQDKLQVARFERLNEQQIGTKIEYENALLNAKNSLSQLNALYKQKNLLLQQAKQQQISTKGLLQNSKIFQEYNQIIVTENGTVIKKLKTNGDFVRRGEVIAVIADEKKIEAVLHVDENSIAKVKLGQTVFIQLNTEKGKVYNGTISEIYSAFDEKTQSFICKVAIADSLSQSYFGTQLEANILIAEKKNSLLVPRQLVAFGNKVNVKGQKTPVIIKPGIVSSEFVEVLDGITTETILLPIKP